MNLLHPSQCPLCNANRIHFYHQDKRRDYYQCDCCQLVFVDPLSLPNAKIEKAEYDLHNNDVTDAGYIQFLQRLCLPLMEKLPDASQGLDFGCGPGPALKQILEQQGHKVSLYDPFYFADTSVLEKHYQFITCTEAIEHFHRPQQQWRQFIELLKPGGWLAIMTKLVISQQRFAHWHYKNDKTHVSFFSRATFDYLAKRDGLEIEYFENDVVILQKPEEN